MASDYHYRVTHEYGSSHEHVAEFANITDALEFAVAMRRRLDAAEGEIWVNDIEIHKAMVVL